MKLENSKINNNVNKTNCMFQTNLRILYDRQTNLIQIRPCCGIYPNTKLHEKQFSYNPEYFIDNFDKCIQDYLNLNITDLSKYFTGICIKSKENCHKLCYGDFNKISIIENCISRSCNLKCIMCSEKRVYNERENQLYRLVNDAVINSEYCKKNLKTYVLTASGEPTLYMNEIYKALDSYIPEISIITNGTLLSDKDIETLNKYKDKLIVSVSFDSIIKEEYDKIRINGNYEKVLHNIKLLNSKGLLLKVHICITDINKETYQKTVSYFNDLGIDVLTLVDNVINLKDDNHKFDINSVLYKGRTT